MHLGRLGRATSLCAIPSYKWRPNQMRQLRWWAGVFVGAVVGLSSAEAGPTPGVINFVEGSVTLAGNPIGAPLSQTARLSPGGTLQTAQGRAEVLLTPGVFVRLAENSALKLISDSPAATRVELLRGEALVEVIEVSNLNRLDVVDKQAYTRPLRDGLYLFEADQPAVRVYQGKARVDDDRHAVSLSTGQELVLDTESPLTPQKFDPATKPAFYAWCEQRAAYLAAASDSTAASLLAFDFGVTHDAGWYWNPWYQSWAFVPERLYRVSPFGYGFYPSEAAQVQGPVYSSFRH